MDGRIAVVLGPAAVLPEALLAVLAASRQRSAPQVLVVDAPVRRRAERVLSAREGAAASRRSNRNARRLANWTGAR
jgi:hypothetical protein